MDLKEPGTGCAFRFGMPRSNKDWSKRLSFKLETLGPTGESHPLTTQRARLRAIIAALQYDKWATKGFTGLVIVTSSKNLVDGIIIRLPVWKRRGWRGQSITIPDRDLWECLMEEISKCKEQGLEVKFWLVPKDHNMNAYWLAHKAVYQNSMLYDGFTKYTAPPWCF